MKYLIIGGTGTLSKSSTIELMNVGHEVTLINRGNGESFGAELLKSDINDIKSVQSLLSGRHFDCVIDFLAFTPQDIDNRVLLFADKTDRYIFISSASAYSKPTEQLPINEETPLSNKFADYSENKRLCEEKLKTYKGRFCYTVVRPSHTYDDRAVPVGVHGALGSYEVLYRIQRGLPVIIHGDGTSLWTLTHARDFARMLRAVCESEQSRYETYTATTGEYHTWNKIYSIIADVSGVPLKPIYVPSDLLNSISELDYRASLTGDKSNNAVFDTSKINSLVTEPLCRISLYDGITECVENINKNPKLQIRDFEFSQFCDKIDREMKSFINNFKAE